MLLISKSKVKKQQVCESLQGRRGIEHRAGTLIWEHGPIFRAANGRYRRF